MAKACIHFMNYKTDSKPDFVNIGSGSDIEISELAKMIASRIGYEGVLKYDTSKPDGTMRKVLDVSKIQSMGWKPLIPLDQGLDRVIQHFSQRQS